MWRNAHDTYLEERILSADPVELIRMLYQGAITAVADARRHLAEGQIQARAEAIGKACNILVELNTSLNLPQGGEFGLRLSHLYGYLFRRLIEANVRQQDEPLAEVAGLLATLVDGWSEVRTAARTDSASEVRWMPPAFAEAEMATAGGWSF